MASKDLLGECNDQGLTEAEFMQIFCARCHNSNCGRASWAGTLWESRIMTQEERLLIHPRFADLTNPMHMQIHNIDFEDRRREALQLHVADQIGDWSVPVIDDEQMAAVGSTTASSVQQAISLLSAKEVVQAPTPQAAAPSSPSPSINVAGNTPIPSTGGIMVGAPAKQQQVRPVLVDAWAVPVKPTNVIPVGGKVVFGGAKKE